MLMSKNRFINTKFWSDNFIIELNPLDRYLFLYFLTNEHTNIAGIYELPLRTISFETGIEKDMLEKMIKRLNGKIFYIDGWVYIKNFEKHNYARGHSKVKIGVENAKKEIPKHILDKIAEISENQIPHTYHIEGGCDSDSDSDSDSNVRNSDREKKQKFQIDDDDIRLAKLLQDLILERQPTFKKPNLENWAKYIEKMKRLDKRSSKQIEWIIKWCQKDTFWQSNILSTQKLREQFDQLVAKALSIIHKAKEEKEKKSLKIGSITKTN